MAGYDDYIAALRQYEPLEQAYRDALHNDLDLAREMKPEVFAKHEEVVRLSGLGPSDPPEYVAALKEFEGLRRKYLEAADVDPERAEQIRVEMNASFKKARTMFEVLRGGFRTSL